MVFFFCEAGARNGVRHVEIQASGKAKKYAKLPEPLILEASFLYGRI
jgi:hypothetical protein